VKSSVGPGKLLKIDLKAFAESLPTHLINQLLQQASSLAVGYAINQRLRNISVFTLGFNIMV
jgi:hypothetical protein